MRVIDSIVIESGRYGLIQTHPCTTNDTIYVFISSPLILPIAHRKHHCPQLWAHQLTRVVVQNGGKTKRATWCYLTKGMAKPYGQPRMRAISMGFILTAPMSSGNNVCSFMYEQPSASSISQVTSNSPTMPSTQDRSPRSSGISFP